MCKKLYKLYDFIERLDEYDEVEPSKTIWVDDNYWILFENGYTERIIIEFRNDCCVYRGKYKNINIYKECIDFCEEEFNILYNHILNLKGVVTK